MIVRTSSGFPAGSGRLRVGLTGLTAALAVLAVACSQLAWRYQEDIAEASRYNGTFDFSQAATEVLRFQMAVDESGPGRTASQLALRYDILRNRLHVIDAATKLGKVDTGDTFVRLTSLLDRIGPKLGRIGGGEGIEEASVQIRPFVAELLRIASRSHSQNGDTVMRNQSELRRVLLGICAITLALVLVGALLVGLFLRQCRRLDRVARADALTGLLNRLSFNTALESSCDPQRAVVLVDVDHFKSINDTLGHHAGDRLLCALAERLAAAAEGRAIVARVGGDEFAALFSGPDAAARSVAFAERVQTQIRQPILIDGREVSPSVTQGLRIASGVDGLTLFNDADIALYAAKIAGRGCYQVFEPAMKADFFRRQKLLADLRGATELDGFCLAYQPIVDLRQNDRLCGFEALVRWRHPELGLVSPTEFVPLAEEGGMIQTLGKWVIGEACRRAAAWPSDLFVAVNVSARQLTDVSIVDHVIGCLAEAGIAGSRLEIEITETTLIENDAMALDVLKRLQALGCRISLDDFGTGYASLSYLRRFRFDKIKIDRSFVRGSPSEGATIVSMICILADRLGMTIVAEGIETPEQREILRGAGSHLGQGFLFSRPLTGEAASALVESEGQGGRRLSGAA